jgi:murein DD-endopeptidase MepM/ murein hydrolase activator NlpD
MRRRWRWLERKRTRLKRERVRERKYTLMVIPEGAGEQVRQFVFTMAHLRRVVTIGAACVVVGVVGVAVSLSVLPRRLAYESLLDENLALKSRLREIESKVDAVNVELRRVRYFSSQLQEPSDDNSDGAGPVDVDELEAMAWMDTETRSWMELELDKALEFDMRIAESGAMHGGEIEDVRVRADRLEKSLDGTLTILRVTESQLSAQAESNEYLRTRWVAMPTDWPVEGILTSGFGKRRSPFTGKWKAHQGIDISTPIGRAIRAPAPGVIISATWNEGYGRMVKIDHGYGVVSRYAHMGKVVVKQGDEVKRGQVLGGVGMTGRTTGPHLHYEIKVDGDFVDPMVFLR